MDGLKNLLIFALLLSYGHLTNQMPQTKKTNDKLRTNTTTPTANATDTNALEASCVTARDVAGTCVKRQNCNFSTSNIDLTLFVSNGYTRPCAVEQVCCPINAIVAYEPTYISRQDDDMFDFDEDD